MIEELARGPGFSWTGLKRKIFPRGLSFTREGKIYVGISLGVGFAAVNTGNNLLFLILGLLLGLIIVSGILSEITLRKIAVRRKAPLMVEEGSQFPVELTLVNKKGFAASFGVELRDEIDGKPFRRRCFFLRVGGKEERSVTYRCELDKRGKAVFQGTIVATRFPFGLFEKRRFISLVDEVIAVPKRIRILFKEPLEGIGRGIGRALLAGAGQDFRQVREMTEGDDPRRIHWRSTARLGEPYVVETDADAQETVEIVLDPSSVSLKKEDLEQAEQNIRAAGTIIRDIVEKQKTVKLVTVEKQALFANDQNSAAEILLSLALIDTVDAASKPPPVGRDTASILIGPRATAKGFSHRLTIPLGEMGKDQV